MKTILLKLAGPLQSWGTESHFEKRHTDVHPSKSVVLGMIAAGLGYRRDNDEQIRLLNELHFAVREDQPGHILRDYHTTHSYKLDGTPNRTYVTERYYIEDAVFVAAVGHENDARVDQIAAAICNPYFQPYLGRRSLPVTADCFLGTFDGDVIGVLKSFPWQASKWYKKHNANLNSLRIYADDNLTGGVTDNWRRDKIVSFSDHGRKYELRGESVIRIQFPEIDGQPEEHDAFAALGD